MAGSWYIEKLSSNSLETMTHMDDCAVSNSFNGNDLIKHSELDLIPTKIMSVQPDPALFVTPEKSSAAVLKRAKKGNDEPSIRKPVLKEILEMPDPELLVTPEKLHSLLKPNHQNEPAKPVQKNKVRFSIPDSSDDTVCDSLSTTTPSTYNESSSLSTEFDEGSSQTTEENSEFGLKAALYTRRNPLADITIGSSQNFDCSTSTGTDGMSTLLSSSDQQFYGSDVSDMPSYFNEIMDMKGKKILQKEGGANVVEPPKPAAVTRIKTAGKSAGHRKNTPAQLKIDQLTNTKVPLNQKIVSVFDTEINDSEKSKKHQLFYLKKKSGLQKHQHSVKYITKSDEEKVPSHDLACPKYNSSLAMGQKLQLIKEEQFDSVGAVMKKMDEDKALKVHVATKASDGTNIDPEEILFKNLVGVDVIPADITTAPELRRVKRAPPPKVRQIGEPDIMDTFPQDLIQEKVTLDSKCYTLPPLTVELTPLESVMSLYERSLCWDALNSY